MDFQERSLSLHYKKIKILVSNYIQFLIVFSLGKSGENKAQGNDPALAATGWEQVCDYQGGVYYVDHVNSKCTTWLFLLG